MYSEDSKCFAQITVLGFIFTFTASYYPSTTVQLSFKLLAYSKPALLLEMTWISDILQLIREYSVRGMH